MSGENLMVLLPIAAMLMASIAVAGLYYWWASGEPEEDEEAIKPFVPEDQSDDIITQIEEKSLGDIFDRAGNLAQSFLAKAGTQISSVREATSTHQTSAQSSPAIVGDAVEVLRVYRDLADGSLVLEVQGKRYHHISQVYDPQVRRRLMGSIEDLKSFASGVTAPLSASSVEAPPPVTSPPAQTPVAPPDVESPVATPPPPPAAPPIPRATTHKKDDDGEEVPLTFAEQIEELLQYRLSLSGELTTQSVHIRDDAAGGVSIEVNGKYYQSVADIEETPIKEFIQNVIQEWEARQ